MYIFPQSAKNQIEKNKGAAEIRMKLNLFAFVNTKKAAFAFLGLISVCAACAACYVWTESFVKYEKTKPIESARAAQSTQSAEIETEISLFELPASDYYTLRLENGKITVYSANGTLLYAEADFSPKALSERDKAELERDGLIVTARSEVIELLTYLKS